jgi:hypothetical protein
MKMRKFAIGMLLVVAAVTVSSAQSAGVPVPRPFPGAPAPPASSVPPHAQAPVVTPQAPAIPPQAAAAPQTPDTSASVPAAAAGPNLPGVPPVYPTAEYLEDVDAGGGQRYYLYGTDAAFAEIVSYYRTVLKNGGREIYRIPAVHQFDLGRFDDNRMVYPPSVVIKDYAGGTTPGYLHVAGTTERRFRTIIQIVPPGAP